MIRLIQRRLIIPRGDTGSFTIPTLKTTPAGNVAVFTIFDPMTHKKIWSKMLENIDTEIMTIRLEHGETVNLPVGQYVWDIKFYENPVIVDGAVISGTEVDSYYAAYKLPICEIRQTGDILLTADDAPTSTISPEQLNIIIAALTEIEMARQDAVNSANSAEDSAENAAASADAAQAVLNELTNLTAEAVTLPTGYNATANYNSVTGILTLGIPEGRGIKSIVLNNDYTLTFTYSDNTSSTTGSIRGPAGYTPIKGTDYWTEEDRQQIRTELSTILAPLQTTLRATQQYEVGDYFIYDNKIYCVTQDIAWNATLIPGVNCIVTTLGEDLSKKADKEDTVLYTTLSRGRTAQSQIGTGSIAFGRNTIASGSYSTSVGNTTQATGGYSHAEGEATTASALSAHAEGSYTVASGSYSHSEGQSTIASQKGAHAEGASTRAAGLYAHAENHLTQASGEGSHAEGFSTFARGIYAHAEGNNTQADGDYSHSENQMTQARGVASHAEGYTTIANRAYQHVQGKYNVVDAQGINGEALGKFASIVGNGTDYNNRSNAYALDWEGNAYYAGDVYVNCETNSTGGDKLATVSEVPTAVSQLTNDSGYLTEHQDISGKADISDIPTSISQLTNDVGYITSFTETDPTVPAWAKAANKPTYTAAEVGAVTTSEVNSLIAQAIGDISSFDVEVVQTLPSENINEHAIYFVPKEGETNDVYNEYIRINDSWEMIGSTQVDLTDYALKSDLEDYALTQDLNDKADKTDTILNTTLSRGRIDGSDIGEGSFAFGEEVEAHGLYSNATGYQTVADGGASHAEGSGTIAQGALSHTEGYQSITDGNSAHAEGLKSVAIGKQSHAEGNNSIAYGDSSHAEGSQNIYRTIQITGNANATTYQYSGGQDILDNILILTSDKTIYTARVISQNTTNNTITVDKTLELALSNTSVKAYSSAAIGKASHIEGESARAVGDMAHAQGQGTIALTNISDVSGQYNIIDTIYPQWVAGTSYNVGDKITYNNSGYECKTANSDSSFTSSKWTNLYHNGNYAVIVGNGISLNNRSNAYTLDWDGNATFAGDVYTNGTSLSEKLAEKYEKPTTGIPASDIASGVIPDVSGFYTKPSGGIPASDIASGVIPDVSNFVTNTDYATSSTGGVVKVDAGYGIGITNGTVYIQRANDADIKTGTNNYKPVTPNYQHATAFYGLAKAAGDTTQAQSDNAVGTYTNDAKTAIKTMLGVTDPSVTDVQVNGTSVVSNGVANIPKASSSTYGAIKIDGAIRSGAQVSGGSVDSIYVVSTSTTGCKNGTSDTFPVTPSVQHASTFYGLAKAAGDTTQSASSNAVGTYTDTAKTAIRSMLGATSNNIIAVQDTTPADADTKIWIDESAAAPVLIPTVDDMNNAIKTVANAIHGGILTTPSVVSNLYINPNSNKFSSTNNNLSVLVIPIEPSCEYAVWKNTPTTMRLAVGNIASPANNDLVSGRSMHDTPSTDMLKITAGPTDTYLYIQLYVNADDEQYKNNEINMKSLIIYKNDNNVVVSGSTPTINCQNGYRYLCGECSTLGLTIPDTGIVDIVFSSGTTPTVLSITGTVRWPGWFTPSALEASATYEINVMNGLGVVAVWS